MALQPDIFALVLAAALAHAAWNAMVKSSGERGATFAVMLLTGGVVSIAGVVLLPLPAAESWIYLLLSVLVHYGYYGFLLLAYRHGDLSHVYPLARGAAPLMVAAGAWAMAGEALAPAGTAGLVLASAGIMSLAFERGMPRGHAGKPVFYALGTGTFIAAYTVIDGIGVRAAQGALGYILWLNVLEAVPMTLWLLLRRPAHIIGQSRGSLRSGVLGGLLASTAYGLVIYALSRGGMANVSALRETSVLFAALIGTVVLKEASGNAGRRIAAAGLVALGVVALQLG